MSTEQEPPSHVMKEWEFLLIVRLVTSRLILRLSHHFQGKIIDQATEQSQENGSACFFSRAFIRMKILSHEAKTKGILGNRERHLL